MEFFDKDGNQIDAEGKIIKTKADIDAEIKAAEVLAKPAVKHEPVVEIKTTDDLVKATIDISKTLSTMAQGSGEMKEAQVKMGKHVASIADEFKTFKEETGVALQELSKDDKALTRSIFDVVTKESKALAVWGYSDEITRALYRKLTEYVPGQGWKHTGEAYEVNDDIMKMNDFLYIAGMVKAFKSNATGTPINYEAAVKSFDTFKLFNAELVRNPELRKALDTGTSGSGAEFVPTGLSAKLIDDIRLALKVAALFQTVRIPGKMGSLELPYTGARQDPYLIAEITADDPSKVGAKTVTTAVKTLTTVRHALRMIFSDEYEEDTVVAVLPMILNELRDAMVGAQENAIINGDITGTHMDSDVTVATDIRKGYSGLRKLSGNASGDAAIDISTLNIGNLRLIYKAQGRLGVQPDQCAWIAGISGLIQLLSLDEVLTMDKFGKDFTVMTGQLAQLDGRPIVVSEYIRQDLNLSGVFDGVTETDTVLLHVNRLCYTNNEKPSGLKIEVGRDIETLANITVASRRIGFTEIRSARNSSEAPVGIGYSLTS